MEGVRFEGATFTPTGAGDGKFESQEVQGVRLVVESNDFDAPQAAIAMLVESYRASGADWTWNVSHFDRLAGTDALRLGIVAGQDMQQLTAGWSEQIRAFETLREPYLIYD
jgi:uncharacterized protein YbbC (DUF1343 family)